MQTRAYRETLYPEDINTVADITLVTTTQDRHAAITMLLST